MKPQSPSHPLRLAFIGGGNMATAIVGGLLASGMPAQHISVIDPNADQRARLQANLGVVCHAEAGPFLQEADGVIWAVKPQTFKAAALSCAAWTSSALHISVAAGIRTDSMAQWLGTERLVRTMPNTPALLGQGTTGLFARAAVTQDERDHVQHILQATGRLIWVASEADLDAVTALSGSGPAYVFYFLEAMRDAGVALGLPQDTAMALATGTFLGAAHLAQSSDEPPQVLRERVTSKGGTTYAALTHMEQHEIKRHFVDAMYAAHRRAAELGDEFGA